MGQTRKISIAFILAIVILVVVTLSSSVTAIGQDSCAGGRCNKTGTDPNFDCQCNSYCTQFGDCCNDYVSLCLGGGSEGSCAGKCDTVGTVPGAPCQCNKPCVDFGDCCPDYADECGGNAGGVTDQELIALSEELLTLEQANNAAGLWSIDLQGATSSGSTADLSPNPLLNIDPAAYSKPTISLLRALHDNYVADVNQNEVVTDQERAEETAFLDAIFATPVFQRFRTFLIAKGYLTEANFRAQFQDIWFGFYSRGSAVGSSGFEHVFLGELKNGVSGLHNWLFFNREESSGNINYNGYLEYGSFGEKGALVGHNFFWKNQHKPISSMLVGTSPELEFSIYTVCWYARPNGKCNIQFNGTKLVVTTYDISYSGKKYVATSYADVA